MLEFAVKSVLIVFGASMIAAIFYSIGYQSGKRNGERLTIQERLELGSYRAKDRMREEMAVSLFEPRTVASSISLERRETERAMAPGADVMP